ncbi:hypothetical protein [Pyxidicoccus trucidator]|uniref:hypothetical protein n=1 Tax=Pyxidicoccus trucidator TaxID=2709662 RepID=UPI0013DC62C7|nr:hypothetical protein [Pyxidicoccus trucidator]
MKPTWKSLLLGSLVALNITACGDDEPKPNVQPEPEPGETIEVSQKITGDTTWEAKNTYVLKTHIFVESGTLTIQPGTVIKGDEGSSLAVTTNAKINASGTREKPIVFTSSKAAGSRSAGNWGGLVLLGKAPINVKDSGGNPTTANIEGYPASQAGIAYGGQDAAHDCGKVKYVRIEFAGFKLTERNELNGLTAGGCGSATEIDYVQVHKGADDGVEMFGGTANLKHVVVTQPDDDGLDWDFGYSGKVQFLIVQQNPDVGNFAFESDNNPNDALNSVPVSTPEVWNVTLIGSNAEPGKAGKTQAAMHLKNGTAGKMNNLIVAYFTDGAADVDGAATVGRTTSTTNPLFIRNSIFFDNANITSGSTLGSEFQRSSSGALVNNDADFDEGAFFMSASSQNQLVDPQLNAALDLERPDFSPRAGSPALNADRAGAPPSSGFFDANARFIGAIGAEDWTEGWTAFPAD